MSLEYSSSGLNPACPLLFSLYTHLLLLRSPDQLTHSLYSSFLAGTIPSSSQSVLLSQSVFPVLSFSWTTVYTSASSLPPLPFQLMTLFLVYSMKAERKHFLAILHLCSHRLHLLFLLSHPGLCSFLWSRICSTLPSHPACISLSYFYWVTLIICR